MKQVPASLTDLDRNRFVHFIGIGGTGMSGLASSLVALGYRIAGSDNSPGDIVDTLRNEGVKIFLTHNSANIFSDTQLVVRSAAVKDDNPEVFAARLRNIPVIKYAEMLGLLMKQKSGIAISGTHGKTTITALVSFVLTQAGLDPGFVVGGDVPQLGGGSRVGRGEYFIAEACEYERSFLSLYPKLAVVNNIEEDHLDCYRDIEEIRNAFSKFIQRIPPDGLLLLSDTVPDKENLVSKVDCTVKYYGQSEEAHYRLLNSSSQAGITTGTVSLPQGDTVSLVLKLMGEHNILNAVAALAISCEAGIKPAETIEILKKFTGVTRRMETLFDRDGQIVMDDYAHHPTEVRTVLASLRQHFQEHRCVVIFQPHQHSRTRFLLKDFARSFSDSDLVIVPDIYFVRDSETEKKNIHSRDLVNEIVKNGGNAVYIPSFGEIEQFLVNNLLPRQLTITMGAGDVWIVGHRLAKRLDS